MHFIDYDIFYRELLQISDEFINEDSYDIFVSAYNKSDRVRNIFDKVRAVEKYWVIHPEYQFQDSDISSINTANVIKLGNSGNENFQVNQILKTLKLDERAGVKLCLDCTGFTRNTLIHLIIRIGILNIPSIDIIFSEPVKYKEKDETSFSIETGEVREIFGCAKEPDLQYSENLLISVGYDNMQVSHVMNSRESVTTHPIYAFPSLQPDMFQQSAYRASRIDFNTSQANEWLSYRAFCPANDPFSTARKLSEEVKKIMAIEGNTNIYLSTLSTKAQAVGFAYYWWKEGQFDDSVVSIVAPECIKYNSDTSIGISKAWKFILELN